MLPWQFFATALSEASNSLIGNANLISKVYFPRLIVPAGAVITSLVDFLISFVILLVLMAWYRFVPGWQFLTAAALDVLGVPGGARAGPVHHGAQRQVPRFPLHHPVHRAVRPVRVAGRVVERELSERLRHFARALLPQPDRGGDRRLPLGASAATPSRSTGRGWRFPPWSTVFFLWFGVWYFRRMERTFADVI